MTLNMGAGSQEIKQDRQEIWILRGITLTTKRRLPQRLMVLHGIPSAHLILASLLQAVPGSCQHPLYIPLLFLFQSC